MTITIETSTTHNSLNNQYIPRIDIFDNGVFLFAEKGPKTFDTFKAAYDEAHIMAEKKLDDLRLFRAIGGLML